jgi:hypothetical protein
MYASKEKRTFLMWVESAWPQSAMCRNMWNICPYLLVLLKSGRNWLLLRSVSETICIITTREPVLWILKSSTNNCSDSSIFLYWLRASTMWGQSSIPDRTKNFRFSIFSKPALRPTQSHIKWVPASISPEVERQRHEDDSYPTSVEAKKACIYSSTPYTPSWCSA